MNPSAPRSDWVTGSATAASMLGIFTFALFPFALPGLVLVVATGLLLALPLLILAAVAAVLAGAFLGIRAAGRGITRARPGLRTPEALRKPSVESRRADPAHPRARSAA